MTLNLFDSQAERLTQLLGGSKPGTDALDRLRSGLSALRERLPAWIEDDATNSDFVVAATQRLLDATVALPFLRSKDKSGYVDMNPVTPADFVALTEEAAPAEVYLLVGVDSGRRYRGVSPANALRSILEEGRRPLTIDDGLSVYVQRPELIAERDYMYLLGARSAQKRTLRSVPAIWVSKGAPRLGWCWENNPHSWLGAGSCLRRLGAE